MKNIIKSLIIIVIIVFLTGCKEGLDPVFYGSLNPTVFPSTEAEYEAYTMEVYIPFTLRWGWDDNMWYYTYMGPEDGIIQLFDAPTDLMTVFSDWGDGDVFWDTKSRGNFAPLVAQSRSRSHFEKTRVITRVTKTIYDLENADVFTNSEDLQIQLISEARLARGWNMFVLLQLFGPVPVIMDAEKVGDPLAEADLTRPARTDYVNWIIDDLRYAANNLDMEAPDYGRFNKGLALTLLMRLHMNEKDFTNAESVGREIQALGYSLVPDYASLFREATERNTETIYAISCDPVSQGRGTDGNFNPFSWYVFPSNYPDLGGWGFVFAATWDFYDSFNPSDTRRTLFIDSYTTTAGEARDRTSMRGAIINKYPPEGENAFQGNDVPIARYADIMLLLAEAINENNGGPTQEAIDLVNEVRTRAGIADLSAPDIANQDAFNDAILQERSWELYFEGLRLPDLVRHDKWPSAVEGIEGKDPGPSIYPLPQYAVVDGAEQNDEYK